MTQKSTLHACELGMITQAAINNITPILFVIFKDNFGISYTMIGALSLLNFLIQLVTDWTAIGIVNRIGYRRSMVMAHIFAGVGLLSLGILPQVVPVYAGLAISVAISAFGGGLLEVLNSPITDSLDLGNSSATMSLVHSFYSWGQLIVVFLTTLAIKAFSADIWYLSPLCWMILPFFNAFLFSKVPMPEISPEEKEKSPLSLFRSPVFIAMSTLMLCAGASEIAMSQWSSLFAQKGLGVNKFMGDLLGPCLFACLMGIGRLYYGLRGKKLKLRKSLMYCSILCIVCYITAAFSQNAYLALAGCAFTGLSVSLMWPGALSYSSKKIPDGGAAMFALLALFGDAGCSFGSALCGAVSDFAVTLPRVSVMAANLGISAEQMSLKIGLSITLIFPIIMLLVLLKQKKTK